MSESISSMTGFARVDAAHGDRRWSWEIKSVNGRGLELRFRLPPGFDFIEHDLRKSAKSTLHRGSLSVSLTMRRDVSAARYRVNQDVLSEVLSMIEKVNERIPCDPPRAEAILSVRGVVEAAEEPDEDVSTQKALAAVLLESFGDGLKALVAMRLKEGEALRAIIQGQLDQVDGLVKDARKTAAMAPEALRDRISTQLDQLLTGGAIPQERIAQEVALLAVKADVREELDRFDAHLSAGRDILKKGGAVGRQLDFLSQEFNREANTLCAKAPDMALKQIGLDLKNTIDQMREQVQNIE